MITFIGMSVVAILIAVGVYAVLTRVKLRSYEYVTDENNKEKVIDKNE
jgi:Tfp pilus assembly major pilin PilA